MSIGYTNALSSAHFVLLTLTVAKDKSSLRSFSEWILKSGLHLLSAVKGPFTAASWHHSQAFQIECGALLCMVGPQLDE